MKEKAQGAIEFLIIMAAVLFIFATFFVIIRQNIEQKNFEREIVVAQDLALSVQNELNLAEASSNGYYREFVVDETLFGKPYNINIIDNRVFVNTTRAGISFPVVSVNGILQKGKNIIRKENGEVLLN